MGCRRKDVLYHTDIYGNEHHYGTMGLETIYFLTEDGLHIRFTDSGLPADFSRQIQVPLNGRFISESLSASADTIFLIGAKRRFAILRRLFLLLLFYASSPFSKEKTSGCCGISTFLTRLKTITPSGAEHFALPIPLILPQVFDILPFKSTL